MLRVPVPLAVSILLFTFALSRACSLGVGALAEAESASAEVRTPAAASAPSEPTPSFTNPVLPFECPDPGVLAEPGPNYFVVCTGGTFAIRQSHDLVHWQDTGASILAAGLPPWAGNGDRNWAPELHRIGHRIIAYFTVSNAADVLSIGVAWADDPLGPYHVLDQPLVEHPEGAIDANQFQDDDGRRYLFYKIDGNAHGLPSRIVVRELRGDGLAFAPGSEPVEVLRNDPWSWEGGVVEATWTIRQGGFYYLFYAGNVYDGRYRTGVARARSITGPYERHGSPILGNGSRWIGPGHGSIVEVGDERWFLHHAWDAARLERGRMGLLHRVEWQGGWPRIGDGTPTDARQPVPGGA